MYTQIANIESGTKETDIMNNLLSEGIKATPPSFVRGILKAASDPSVISFAGGLPNPVSFPQEKLMQSMERIVKTYGSAVFQYSITAGLPELRQYIADRYNKIFRLDITIDNIIITTGSQQALDLIGKVLLDQGDGIIIEKPTYLAAIQTFHASAHLLSCRINRRRHGS